jgi:hypothetical protein
LAYGFWSIGKELAFPGYWALIPVIGTLLILMAGPNAWINRFILSNKVAVWFGLISYPLYLWHWPLLSFARIIESEVPGRHIRIAAVLLSVVLAWLTYRFIERPIRFGKHWRLKVKMMVFTLAVIGSIGYWVYREDGLHSRAIITHNEKVNLLLEGTFWKYTANENCVKNFGNTFTSWCMLSEDSQEPTILLLGDSFANNLYPGLVSNTAFKGEIILNFSSCTLSKINSCNFIHKKIDGIKSIKYAYIAYRYIDLINFQSELFLINQIRFLRKKNIKIFLLGPKPELDYDIKGCFSRPFRAVPKSCYLSASQVEKQEMEANELIQKLLRKYPEVTFIDQNALFKSGNEEYSFKKDGLPLLRDGKDYGHLSELGSNALSGYLEPSYLKFRGGQ